MPTWASKGVLTGVAGGVRVRPFETKTALASLKADGWLWKNKRPLKAVQAWVKRMAEQAGLTKKEKS